MMVARATWMTMAAVVMTSLMTSVKAQVPGTGPCPDVKSLTTLDVNKYLGAWYEIYRFPIVFEGNSRCVKANYSIKADGHIKVLNSDVTADGKTDVMEGDAYAPDPSKPAQLLVKFNNFIPDSNYWVLDTDYEGHSLVFSCNNLSTVAHVEFAWILSRQRTLDDSVVKALQEKLQGFGVDPEHFEMTDQTNCPDTRAR